MQISVHSAVLHGLPRVDVQAEELLRAGVHHAPVLALLSVCALKWRLSERHDVEEHAQTENISLLAIVVISFSDDLGGHVGWRAADTTKWHLQALCEAIVAQSQRVIESDQDILKLDISMAHFGFMRCVNCLKDLREETHQELRLLQEVAVARNNVEEVCLAELADDALGIAVDLFITSNLDRSVRQVLVLIDHEGAITELFDAVVFV